MRARFQVLVLPFILENGSDLKVAVFKRADGEYWQFIAGGGEGQETHLQAAQREAYEEARIASDNKYYALDTTTSVPKCFFSELKDGKGFYVVPEFSFAVLLEDSNLKISGEHLIYEWMDYNKAYNSLKYDSNRNALWELQERIKDGTIE